MQTYRSWGAALLLAASLAGMASLSGCASGPTSQTAMLTYETTPEGAELFEGGKSIGTAPVTRTYTGDGKSASIRTPEVTAVWPSGAKESYYAFIDVGSDRKATIERPAKAPGLQADQDNAKKFAALREKEATRKKEEIAREVARGSDRCKAQMARGGPKAGVDDCI
jgi:hypothetical protein